VSSLSLLLRMFFSGLPPSVQVQLSTTGQTVKLLGKNLRRKLALVPGDVVRIHSLQSRGVEYNGACVRAYVRPSVRACVRA
jgi:hypothetical protein